MHDINNQAHFKQQFRSLIIYMIYLIISSSVLLNISAPYWMTNILEDDFINTQVEMNDGSEIILSKISKLDHLWNTIDNIFFDSDYWSYWYKDYGATYKVLEDNIILGAARLRQVQVRTNSCDIPDGFRSLFKKCYAEYSVNTELKEPFGLKNGSAWTYTNAADINCVYHYGVAGTYGCDGYYQILSLYSIETKRMLNQLRRNLWISRQSRAVIIEMNVYNGNMNAICILKIIFELPATGGVIASRRIDTVKLVPYADKYDYFILSCAFIYIGFLIFYTVEFILQLKKRKRWKFLLKIWNCVEMLIILMGYGFLVIRLYIVYLACVALDEVHDHPESYVSFERLGYWNKHINTLTGVLFFVMWIKVFKFMDLNKTLTELKNTFSNSSYNIAGFMVTFVICFAAYGQLGYLLFGKYRHAYSTVAKSMFTLFKMIHGEMDRTNFVTNPFFFCSFIFIVYFILLNMFLAIINDAYTMIKHDLTSLLYMNPRRFLNTGGSKIFAKCKRIHKYFAREAAKKDDDEGMKNVKKFLRLAKYTDLEIDLLFSMYQFGQNTDISDTHLQSFVKEILKHKRNVFEAADYIQGKYGEPEFMSPNELREHRFALDALERNLAHLNRIVDDVLQGQRTIKADKRNI